MTFDVPADAYARFMRVYSEKLAPEFVDAAGVSAGQQVLDLGCGPGALTAVLVERLGSDHVAALDPSEPFAEAASRRLPGVDIRLAAAESIPFDDDSFDLALAELVVQFSFGDEARDALRQACAACLRTGPFTIDASAWTAVGTV